MQLARLTVDLGALRTNYRLVSETAGRAGAVVKANAYGLGAVRVASALVEEGCTDFFVATVAEGMELAGRLGLGRIFVLSGPLDEADAARMAGAGLVPVLNDQAQAALWRDTGQLPAAIHVDTGMHRLGFATDALDPAQFGELNVVLLLSHLANADVPGDRMTARQIKALAALRALFPGVPTSLSNSAGALSGVPSDLARPGIALYGGSPFADAADALRPVATLEARVIALRTVPAGQPVGYGGTFTTRRETRVATLGIGYADGVPRALSNRGEVAYQGTRLPIVGRVSMDLLQVDATAVGERIEVADWIEIFGQTVTLDEVADAAGTIGYEMLTGIGTRVERRYIDG